MKKLATLTILAFALSLTVVGCAKKGDTKDEAEVTEERTIEPASSGGMQRMEEEEEAAPVEDEAAEPSADDEEPSEEPDEAPAPE